MVHFPKVHGLVKGYRFGIKQQTTDSHKPEPVYDCSDLLNLWNLLMYEPEMCACPSPPKAKKTCWANFYLRNSYFEMGKMSAKFGFEMKEKLNKVERGVHSY